ncbi:Cys loop ligand gated ion channel subunit [Echinococcus multilocularis]|uniref:Cys loop ligand gated ion channel subunit n=1 Tax=Echinococcus multilocularis TaxID=6211 RepID=A0A068YKG1_ECHMU|nr:Cys loop ligand gated ion channel subunit [Echinococcus multilocularis]
MSIRLSSQGPLTLLILPLLTSCLHAAAERPQELARQPLFNFDRLINFPVLPQVTTGGGEPAHPVLKQNLIKHLMRHYRRYERPTEGTHEPTRVRVSIKILAITSVDVINMQYTADMVLVQTWKDPRLRWQNLLEYQAISGDILLTHKRNEIWLPDLFFRNGKEGFLYRMTVPNHMIRVSPDGSVYYSQKITMKLACEMHLRNFPMDHQDCDMDIGSYGYTIDQLKFIWDGDNALKFADDMLISEFNTPSSTITEDCTEPQTTSTGTYTCLLGRFQLKRQVGSYLVGTYVPAFLIVIVSWLTFWVSPEAIPARVTLGLLTLISLLTKIASLNNTLPRVSYIKAIDIWLIACLIFVISAMLEFTLASYWSRKVFLSKWRDQVRQTVRTTLAKVVCPCRSPRPHRMLLRCTCCGLINPQYHETGITSSPYVGQGQREYAPGCACAQNSYRAVKFDMPLQSCNQIECNQIYDNKSAMDHSPQQTMRRNSGLQKSRAMDHNCTTTAVVVASPVATSQKYLRSCRSRFTPSPSTDIQMSVLPSRRKKQRVTFSHGSGRRTCRSIETALCQHHPLPERYLQVREVEIDEDSKDGDASSTTATDSDLNSEIDAYSRFLFPCCFVLYNCAYWGFYLIISDPGFMT